MDDGLRLRLDALVALCSAIAVLLVTLVFAVGGAELLAGTAVFGTALGLLVVVTLAAEG